MTERNSNASGGQARLVGATPYFKENYRGNVEENFVPEWIVFRQIPTTSPCADLWDMEYVNIEAENQKEACEKTAMDKGEGRYCAFPNTTAEYFEIKIRKIAEVESAPGESLV